MSEAGGNPFRDLLELQSRMNRLFEEALGRSGEPEAGAEAPAWSPPTDVVESDGDLVLRVELPGLSRDDVRLAVEDGVLQVQGERPADPQLAPEAYHRRERWSGAFRRSFRLPEGVDPSGIRARLRDGVLEVRLPRQERRGPSARIEVK